MNDRFKYRVWNVSEKKYLDWEYLRLCGDLGDIINRGSTQCQIIEQCTGLKDKNGKFIYEGDIVDFSKYYRYRDVYLVEYETAGFEPFSDSRLNCRCCGGGENPNDCEIIGNINENPDLLEK